MSELWSCVWIKFVYNWLNNDCCVTTYSFDEFIIPLDLHMSNRSNITLAYADRQCFYPDTPLYNMVVIIRPQGDQSMFQIIGWWKR